ncbi:cytochrome P450 CYP4BN1 [Tribolium castaneum]|uniref:Cytochrome P450-like protein n=1 Tax=Tribolium castaneum TaxID=7070 RepID=D6WKD3_TRICA|nr:cytochrome P450 CYP4BN1 [Tribolium castaneum]EFA04665.2 cytochrome P450-like protein [Tribolium castaneum]|eukprot:NP_001123993.1 cytochrome P450 CYP4BN1 [Tribolium castaneum]
MGALALVVFAVTTLLFLIWFIRLVRKNNDYYKDIPGPRPLFFFGNVFEVSTTRDILNVMHKYALQFNGLYKIHLGPVRKLIIASDYKFLECVLSSMKILNKSEDYLYLRPWLGTGLLTSDGPKWKKHRKIITPAFHFQILEQFVEVFESGGNRFVQQLQKEVGKKSVDIYPYVTLCTLDIICESAMGISINAQFDDNSDYVRSVKAMCRITMERLFHLLEMNDVTYPLTKNYYTQKKSLNVLHNQTNSVINRRRKELENKTEAINVTNEDKADNNDTLFGRNKKAFLDLLLQATVDGRPLTQEEIREEVDTFMFEGHDTTASAISFAIYCLANNADVQAKAYEEQIALFGGNKSPAVTYSDLQSMKYLELVIKETLRLYPSVPMFARKTSEPVQYENIFIPEGVTVNIFAYGIHRDPKYFKDPEKFDPSRFETVDGKLPYAYIPFSAGPRNCIGQKFAMLEMKSTISKVLRNFELQPATPTHTVQLAAESVLKSANGVKIALKNRN